MLSQDGANYVPSSEVLKTNHLSPLNLGPKEGLALINGTQFIAAHAIVVSEKLARCLDYADIIGAVSLESMLESHKPFDERLHKLRSHPGALAVAKRMRAALPGGVGRSVSSLIGPQAMASTRISPYFASSR